MAVDSGVEVIINGYSFWEDIDLDLAGEAFGLSNMISEDEFKQLKEFHKAELSSLEGVTYLKTWENMETFDGLHPQDKYLTFTANEIARAIVKMETGEGRR